MKTNELIGPALDWAVAKAIGEYKPVSVPAYSTDWAQGGPIIEREGITVSKDGGGWAAYFRENLFEDDGSEFWRNGPTPLIAAMRCYSASKLGDDVTLPPELEQSA